MLGRGLATGSLTLLLALAGTAEARGQDDGRGQEAGDDRSPERGPPDAEAGAASTRLGLSLGEPEPGSACRPQC